MSHSRPHKFLKCHILLSTHWPVLAPDSNRHNKHLHSTSLVMEEQFRINCNTYTYENIWITNYKYDLGKCQTEKPKKLSLTTSDVSECLHFKRERGHHLSGMLHVWHKLIDVSCPSSLTVVRWCLSLVTVSLSGMMLGFIPVESVSSLVPYSIY